MAEQKLLELEHLRVWYPVRGGVWSRVKGHVKAVEDVSLTIREGEALGLVGESGCGKSTLGRAVIHLEKVTAGRILFEGADITHLDRKEMLPWRSKMQMVFQDPYSSFNPRRTVAQAIGEILQVHKIVPPEQAAAETDRLLELTGLNPKLKDRFPYEFSGGQRQRIGIARALAMRPKLLICDEATSALDVSVQAQILEVLQNLRWKTKISCLFISHSLGAVKYISDRVAVMYLGHIVEIAETGLLFSDPQHPYTQALLGAYPNPDPDLRGSNRIVLEGGVPDPADPPPGCPFSTRCPFAKEICRTTLPELAGEEEHRTACHFRISRGEWRSQ